MTKLLLFCVVVVLPFLPCLAMELQDISCYSLELITLKYALDNEHDNEQDDEDVFFPHIISGENITLLATKIGALKTWIMEKNEQCNKDEESEQFYIFLPLWFLH